MRENIHFDPRAAQMRDLQARGNFAPENTLAGTFGVERYTADAPWKHRR